MHRPIAAGIAYVVLTFAIAFTWHLVLFKSLYDELAIFTRAQPIIPLGIASIVLQAVIIVFMYSRWPKSGSAARDGLRFGLLIGALMATIAVLAEAGKQNVTSLGTWLILESVYYLLQFGMVGMVIGLIFAGRKGGEAIRPRSA